MEGNIIYCDDVRVEASGKLILIGVYNTDLFINGSDIVNRLCLVCRIKIPLESIGKKLSINIYLPADRNAPSFSQDLPEIKKPTDDEIAAIPRAWKDGPLFANLMVPINLENISVDDFGFIKAEIVCEGASTRLNSLKISALPSSSGA